MSEEEQYADLQNRCDEQIANARVLLADAYRERDYETVWFCKASISDLRRKKADMRKPGEPRR